MINDLIVAVKNRLRIEKLISDAGIEIKKTGSSLMAKCCFHDETTPSLSIDVNNQFFNCFSCHTSGDVLTWISYIFIGTVEPDKNQFLEVLKEACRLADIPFNSKFERTARIQRQAESLLEKFVVLAENCWTRESVQRAVQYKSYLNIDMIKRWRLGYSPTQIQCHKSGITDEYLRYVGLLRDSKNSDDSPYMHFRDSIIIPYFEGGRIVYVSDRALGQRNKLKLNLPSPKKKNEFAGGGVKRPCGFNLNAIKHARKIKGDLLVVEGPFDAIYSCENGHPAVAMLTSKINKKLVELLQGEAV